MPTPATGDREADLTVLIASFQGDLATATLIASGATLASYASAAHPNISARGGELGGLVAAPSRAAGNNLFLIDGAGVGVAGGELLVDAVFQASVELSDTPDGPAAMISLWQNDLAALKVEQIINWARGRPGAVAWVQAP